MIAASDLLYIGIATLTMVLGLAAIVAGFVRRATRDLTPLWFGLFALLYGVRLLGRIVPIQQIIGLPHVVFGFIDCAITYAILGPAILAYSGLLGAQNILMRRLWQADFAFAAVAITMDLVRAMPGTMIPGPTRVLVGANILVLLVVVSRMKWSVRTVGGYTALAGLIVFVLLAGWETFTGRSLFGAPISLEPIGMLFFVAGLGALVAEGVVSNERRLFEVARELEMAARIQESILPREVPKPHGASVAARYFPMAAVAGDFYDFLGAADDGFGVLVADVSGHGVPAALIASMVKVALASQSDDARYPGLVLSRMNRVLFGKFELAYITAVYAWIDLREGRVRYAAAGHPPPLRRTGATIERLDGGGLIMGFDANARYDDSEVPLSQGDCILFYTDGLTEADRPDGEFFGDRKLEECIRNSGSADPDLLLDALLNELHAWRGSNARDFADDVTMVAVAVGTDSHVERRK